MVNSWRIHQHCFFFHFLNSCQCFS